MGRWELGELQVLIFCEVDQKCSKFPLASDYMAISGPVDSTTSLVYGFYVPPIVFFKPRYSRFKVATGLKVRFKIA